MSFDGNEEGVSSGRAHTLRSGAAFNNMPELRIKWTDTQVQKLCCAVRPFPYMYDPEQPNNKDRELKKRTWLTIAKNTGIVGDPRKHAMFAKDCERKFRNLKDEHLKALKRLKYGKSTVPYKHSVHLGYLNYERLLNNPEDTVYYDGGNETADLDYNQDAMNAQDSETTYAANDHGDAYNDGGYEEAPPRLNVMRALNSAKHNSSSSYNAGRHYSRLTYCEPKQEPYSSPQILVQATGTAIVKPTDELEDFTNMLLKRLRRLPRRYWGQVVTRVVETVSMVEENAEKATVTSTSCQTDD